MYLENGVLSCGLEDQIGAFIKYYDHHRNYERLGNVTLVDDCVGRASDIPAELTLYYRRILYH